MKPIRVGAETAINGMKLRNAPKKGHLETDTQGKEKTKVKGENKSERIKQSTQSYNVQFDI